MATRMKSWKMWCVQCKKVQLFRTPKGKDAPFSASDWTDESGHQASLDG